MKNIRSKTYHSELNELQDYDNATIDLMRRTERNVVTMADIDHEGITFTVATTHFAWTPNGMMTGYQQEDAQALLKILAAIPELTLCGDFNAPRGFNGVYDLFAAQYEDAIPRSYVSSLDPAYHRAYNDPVAVKDVSQFMVDYLFLSKKYAARDVRLQSGVSDHCAVVATIVPRIMNS